MVAHTVALVIGSIRKESFNKKLAQALVKLAPKTLRFETPQLDDLPPYNQDRDKDFPPAAKRFKQQIAACGAALFVTAEYNRSIPGLLKNAIDWASRPYGDSAWAGKPAAVAGASPGSISTAVAQQHLRTVLAYLDMPTLGQPEVFVRFTDGLIDADGNVTKDDTRKFLADFMERYAVWVDDHAPAGRAAG